MLHKSKRKKSEHKSREICPRGDSPRSGGKAWRDLSETGYRHRSLQSQKSRREGAAAQEKGSVNRTLRRSAMNQKKTRAQKRPSPTRSKAVLKVLKGEPHSAASHLALSRQTHQAAKKRGPKRLHLAAVKAVRTTGHAGLSEAAKKAARTRRRAA